MNTSGKHRSTWPMFVSALLIVMLMLAGCGSGGSGDFTLSGTTNSTGDTAGDTTATTACDLDGVTLFNQNCAGCHPTTVDNSAKHGATPERIQFAIENNLGNMGYLSSLSDDEVFAISVALEGATCDTTDDGTTDDGTTDDGTTDDGTTDDGTTDDTTSADVSVDLTSPLLGQLTGVLGSLVDVTGLIGNLDGLLGLCGDAADSSDGGLLGGLLGGILGDGGLLDLSGLLGTDAGGLLGGLGLGDLIQGLDESILSGLLSGIGICGDNGLLDLGGLLGGLVGAPLDAVSPVGTVVNLVDDVADGLLFNLDVGGITAPVLSVAGNLINIADPIYQPLLKTLQQVGMSLTATVIPIASPTVGIAGDLADMVTDQLLPSVLSSVIAQVNGITGGEIKALIPMPLDPNKACEDCHHSKAALVLAMADVVNNLKYPGLAADIPFVDNFYVQPEYTKLADSMMSKAVDHELWDGCKTCHGTGETFNPFPSDNWVPDVNPNDGPEVAKGWGTTNDVSNSCGKCHAANAANFNEGIMGTHRGHLWAFNYNDVELDGVNTESQFYQNPFGPTQDGTDMSRLPLDRNGETMHSGYYASRASCSNCHQGCSDCHLTGPGDSPSGTLALIDITKGTLDPVELVNVDQDHIAPAVRLKAVMSPVLRRGGVVLAEMRRGYMPGIFRGVPFTIWEMGMDVTNHKMHKPTTAEQGNTLAPQTQQQSIDFCWRCHFRSGAEFQGNYVSVVPNPNYSKKTLGHLQAGMTCTDCHKHSEMHGATSRESQSFAGTFESDKNPSHPGGNPVGSTPAWDITPNPIKVRCGLCHTNEGKALGVTGGLNWGPLVTDKFQKQAPPVKGLGYIEVPGKTSTMAHSNVKCEACHTQAQQQCWNCHLEKPEELTGFPLIGSNDLGLSILPTNVNVREAEGEPHLTDEQNARLMENPNRADAANISIVLTFPDSINTVSKQLKYLARNNEGLVGSVVHCPGPPLGNNNLQKDPQILNQDGGLYMTKSGEYGREGAVPDVSLSAEGSWYMEGGHSIARAPDGTGFTACYNCHADTVRMGAKPITYYRKNPWIMESIGVPEALMPASHYADDRFKGANSTFNCNCHTPTGLVHNGTFEGPWQIDILPSDGHEGEGGGEEEETGESLYAANCAGCHLALDSTTKPGRTAAAIQNAINLNIGGMGYLSTLTAEQVQMISDALQ